MNKVWKNIKIMPETFIAFIFGATFVFLTFWLNDLINYISNEINIWYITLILNLFLVATMVNYQWQLMRVYFNKK